MRGTVAKRLRNVLRLSGLDETERTYAERKVYRGQLYSVLLPIRMTADSPRRMYQTLKRNFKIARGNQK